MTEPSVIWGALFSVYILAGIPALNAANNGAKPKGVPPGSSRLKQWEDREARGDKWLKLWGVGFAILIGAWWLLS